jgi:ABC-2 type transport system ATP-binding protein
MIEAHELTKRYGDKIAVDRLSFTIAPGQVTGFLGPNGAGKSTTMRMIVGLDRPNSGTATIAGRRYVEHPAPLRRVGALLEASSFHKGRTAFHHLLALAQTHAIGSARVHEVLALTGLESVAHRRAGGFSLGMAQRLGIAGALIGDPEVILLDEPVNGLDPDGVIWIRTLLKQLASEGRSVLISSHLMSEMAITADHLLVIGRGRLLADTPIADLIARVGVDQVLVRSPQATELRDLLVQRAATVTPVQPGLLRVRGMSAELIGVLAAESGVVLYELAPQRASLEQAYLQLTRAAVEFSADQADAADQADQAGAADETAAPADARADVGSSR